MCIPSNTCVHLSMHGATRRMGVICYHKLCAYVCTHTFEIRGVISDINNP